MNVAELQPRRREPPVGWPPEVFEALTDAVASALVSAYRRASEREASENVSPDSGP